MEILKDFVKINEKGFEDYYISKDGRLVKLYKNGNIKFINPRLDAYGYMRVSITDINGKRKDRKMHRLMAQTFIPNPENKPTVNHKDGNKQNNSVENLEWATLSEQQIHAYGNGLNSNSCELNPGHKLTLSQVEWIKEHYIKRDKTFGVIALAKRFNVHRKTIGRIVNGQSWKEGDAKCQG